MDSSEPIWKVRVPTDKVSTRRALWEDDVGLGLL
jgi:hypothetical protein